MSKSQDSAAGQRFDGQAAIKVELRPARVERVSWQDVHRRVMGRLKVASGQPHVEKILPCAPNLVDIAPAMQHGVSVRTDRRNADFLAPLRFARARRGIWPGRHTALTLNGATLVVVLRFGHPATSPSARSSITDAGQPTLQTVWRRKLERKLRLTSTRHHWRRYRRGEKAAPRQGLEP